MKRFSIAVLAVSVAGSFLLIRCKDNSAKSETVSTIAPDSLGGYPTRVKWGEHLVAISGCNDCHTPKKMSPMGPVPDTANRLSGHPANMPPLPVDPKEMGGKGLVVTSDLTTWIGPWGISYSANLTPDDSGIKNWNEQQFVKAIREGKYMGLDGGRTLLPPMPWQELGAGMTDNELKAIFSYLKSIKPIHNVVPQVVLAKH